ncbi:hypothetical protein MTP99_016551 [Tenebrio molitor]|nr:hypothetical protein MTP99_016551 [Tenebrio molitor]
MRGHGHCIHFGRRERTKGFALVSIITLQQTITGVCRKTGGPFANGRQQQRDRLDVLNEIAANTIKPIWTCVRRRSSNAVITAGAAHQLAFRDRPN